MEATIDTRKKIQGRSRKYECTVFAWGFMINAVERTTTTWTEETAVLSSFYV
jgi:hypothetical protein